jgi:hypothetical protein
MMRKQDNFLENILWLKRQNQAMGPKYVVIKEHGALLFHDLQVFFTSFAIGRGFDPTGRRYFCGGLQDLLHKVKTYHSKT